MAVAAPPWVLEQLFDNDGRILAGGKLYFKAGTADGAPLAAYTDASGETAVTNPLILDSSGRCQFWLTENTAYALILTDALDVTIETVENIIVNPQTAFAPASVDIYMIDADDSPPVANQWICGAEFRRPLTFPANFANAGLALNVAPTGVLILTCRKNSVDNTTGTVVGTLTVQTDKTYVFDTSDAEVDIAIGDWLDWYGPAVPDLTAKGFRITMPALVTGSAPGDFVTSTDVDAAIAAAIDTLMIGKIVALSNSSVPAGWLACNGTAISRTTYAKLFTKIGTENGAGNGTTTFNLPDLQGYFLRGWDPAHTIDTDRADQFDTQTDAFQGHRFQIVLNADPADAGMLALEVADSDATTTTITTGDPITDGTHGTPRTASETRPVNKAVIWIIYAGATPA